MKTTPWKPNLLMTILVPALSFAIILLLGQLAYVFTLHTKSCNSGDDCFFTVPTTNYEEDISPAAAEDLLINYYLPTFQELFADDLLNLNSKSLCIGTLAEENADALREIGVTDSISISKIPFHFTFDNNTFDLVLSGNAVLDRSDCPAKFASEVTRILKPGGFFVFHTASKDSYSLHSLLNLFSLCKLIKSREIHIVSSEIQEIVLKKEMKNGVSANNGSVVEGYKFELIKKLEPLIKEEEFNRLGRNVQNFRFLPSMVDISFKHRYIYIDIGARHYASSIGGWFKKKYPKQNKKFEIFAIEADKSFHEEYRLIEGVTLLPYAAWIRNETLFFEINRDPASGTNEEKVTGMGRVQSVHSSSKFIGDLNKIEGFDFAEWLKRSVTENDFVVVKMDVEGSEFHLIPRLLESGGIGLIDEMFIECHIDMWRTFDQCLEMFSSLRERGVLVHQWWL